MISANSRWLAIGRRRRDDRPIPLVSGEEGPNQLPSAVDGADPWHRKVRVVLDE